MAEPELFRTVVASPVEGSIDAIVGSDEDQFAHVVKF